MKLKLDENLGQRTQDALRSAGHDVSTVLEQSLSGAPDQQVIDTCGSEGRALVTLDLDFANPLRFRPEDYAGIVVLRLPGHAAPDDLTEAVSTLLRGLTRSSPLGRLWVVQRGAIREHEPRSSRDI